MKLELKIAEYISFRVYFKLFLRVGGWWVGVENEMNVISAFNLIVVEVEAGLGNNTWAALIMNGLNEMELM